LAVREKKIFDGNLIWSNPQNFRPAKISSLEVVQTLKLTVILGKWMWMEVDSAKNVDWHG